MALQKTGLTVQLKMVEQWTLLQQLGSSPVLTPQELWRLSVLVGLHC
jgi:hypothetical protein